MNFLQTRSMRGPIVEMLEASVCSLCSYCQKFTSANVVETALRLAQKAAGRTETTAFPDAPSR